MIRTLLESSLKVKMGMQAGRRRRRARKKKKTEDWCGWIRD